MSTPNSLKFIIDKIREKHQNLLELILQKEEKDEN